MDRPSPSRARSEPAGTTGGIGGPSGSAWASVPAPGRLPPATVTSGGPASGGSPAGRLGLGVEVTAVSPAAEAGMAASLSGR
eukprot:636071-Alexandrium_andersonii.AAC.1